MVFYKSWIYIKLFFHTDKAESSFLSRITTRALWQYWSFYELIFIIADREEVDPSKISKKRKSAKKEPGITMLRCEILEERLWFSFLQSEKEAELERIKEQIDVTVA